jgi:hypothetical protein
MADLRVHDPDLGVHDGPKRATPTWLNPIGTSSAGEGLSEEESVLGRIHLIAARREIVGSATPEELRGLLEGAWRGAVSRAKSLRPLGAQISRVEAVSGRPIRHKGS